MIDQEAVRCMADDVLGGYPYACGYLSSAVDCFLKGLYSREQLQDAYDTYMAGMKLRGELWNAYVRSRESR